MSGVRGRLHRCSLCGECGHNKLTCGRSPSSHVAFQVREHEATAIVEAARAAGMTVSEYARRAVLAAGMMKA